MANEYVFEDEHFTPKFSASFLYRGIEETWIGDGNSETREDYNDHGYLYAKYQDGHIIKVGQTIAPETIEAATLAEASAQNAANSASAAANSASSASVDAQNASLSASSARGFSDSSAYNAGLSEDMRYRTEGYAYGTQDGVDVDTTSPYYHNNAKYYYDTIVQGGSGYDLYDYFNWDSYYLANPAPGQIVIYLFGPFLIGFVDLVMNDNASGEISHIVNLYSNSEPLYSLDQTRAVTIPIVALYGGAPKQEIGAAMFTFSSQGDIIRISISREALPESVMSASIRGSFILPLANNS